MQSVIEQQINPDTARESRFAPVPASVGAARRYVAATCFDWGLPELVEDATLAAGELVTNAVQHVRWQRYPSAARVIGVRLARTAHRLTIAVDDPDPRRPETCAQYHPAKVAEPDLDGTELHGNGLRIVRSRALEFGVGAGACGGKSVWFALSTSGHTRVLARALTSSDTAVDAEWTAWSRAVLTNGLIDGATLAQMWREIVEFDDVLADYLADPIPVPERTVIVTGSGKETFKTFNVSTAAAILAAAAGARIVKGVSTSVSAISGSADILHTLGIPVLDDPRQITATVCRIGLAFIPYSAFCPRYAARYDGRFGDLSPMSFFMPTATLAVDTDRFVHGLAHPNVEVSAAGIIQCRSELTTGRVVTARLSDVEQVDEIVGRGANRIAVVSQRAITVTEQELPPAEAAWRRAVRHRASHTANAAVLADALSPRGNPHICDLVERNSAAILATSSPNLDPDTARCEVRDARESGRAISLLQRLSSTREVTPR
jgi:anthranilate phosphoribosyltransferase